MVIHAGYKGCDTAEKIRKLRYCVFKAYHAIHYVEKHWQVMGERRVCEHAHFFFHILINV